MSSLGFDGQSFAEAHRTWTAKPDDLNLEFWSHCSLTGHLATTYVSDSNKGMNWLLLRTGRRRAPQLRTFHGCSGVANTAKALGRPVGVAAAFLSLSRSTRWADENLPSVGHHPFDPNPPQAWTEGRNRGGPQHEQLLEQLRNTTQPVTSMQSCAWADGSSAAWTETTRAFSLAAPPGVPAPATTVSPEVAAQIFGRVSSSSRCARVDWPFSVEDADPAR